MDFCECRYIGVGDNETVQLFYYFVESQRSPSRDPLLFWITGGPGCSSLAGFFFESGMFLLIFFPWDVWLWREKMQRNDLNGVQFQLIPTKYYKKHLSSLFPRPFISLSLSFVMLFWSPHLCWLTVGFLDLGCHFCYV